MNLLITIKWKDGTQYSGWCLNSTSVVEELEEFLRCLHVKGYDRSLPHVESILIQNKADTEVP